MKTITLTAKRQATFPVEVCEALAVGPGSEIVLENRVVAGERVWLMRPKRPASRAAWLGALKRHADRSSIDHAMSSIRDSIAQRGRSVR